MVAIGVRDEHRIERTPLGEIVKRQIIGDDRAAIRLVEQTLVARIDEDVLSRRRLYPNRIALPDVDDVNPQRFIVEYELIRRTHLAFAHDNRRFLAVFGNLATITPRNRPLGAIILLVVELLRLVKLTRRLASRRRQRHITRRAIRAITAAQTHLSLNAYRAIGQRLALLPSWARVRRHQFRKRLRAFRATLERRHRHLHI